MKPGQAPGRSCLSRVRSGRCWFSLCYRRSRVPETHDAQELFRSGNNLYSTIIPLLQLWSCQISWFIIQAVYRVGRGALRSTLRLPKESNTSACAGPLLLNRTKSTILVVLYFQKFVIRVSYATYMFLQQWGNYFVRPKKCIAFFRPT